MERCLNAGPASVTLSHHPTNVSHPFSVHPQFDITEAPPKDTTALYSQCIVIKRPSKQKALNQCCLNVDPTSATLAQHQTNIDLMSCVWLGGLSRPIILSRMRIFNSVNFENLIYKSKNTKSQIFLKNRKRLNLFYFQVVYCHVNKTICYI